MADFAVTFSENNVAFTTDMSGDANFNADFGTITNVSVSDHNKLTNRDADNQHPIKAITGLRTELNDKMKSSDVLTNMEIQAILNS